VLQCPVVCCSVLQCVAVCGSVAVCCSVLQCVAADGLFEWQHVVLELFDASRNSQKSAATTYAIYNEYKTEL